MHQEPEPGLVAYRLEHHRSDGTVQIVGYADDVVRAQLDVVQIVRELAVVGANGTVVILDQRSGLDHIVASRRINGDGYHPQVSHDP